MTSINELTRLLHRWLKEHQIPVDDFTLILNFGGEEGGLRFDCALRHELEQTSFMTIPTERLDMLRSFRMNGVSVRVESPIHEVAS